MNVVGRSRASRLREPKIELLISIKFVKGRKLTSVKGHDAWRG